MLRCPERGRFALSIFRLLVRNELRRCLASGAILLLFQASPLGRMKSGSSDLAATRFRQRARSLRSDGPRFVIP